MSVTIENRTYTAVEINNGGSLAAAQLIQNGFDGTCWILTGKRGATKLAYRKLTGEFVIVL